MNAFTFIISLSITNPEKTKGLSDRLRVIKKIQRARHTFPTLISLSSLICEDRLNCVMSLNLFSGLSRESGFPDLTDING